MSSNPHVDGCVELEVESGMAQIEWSPRQSTCFRPIESGRTLKIGLGLGPATEKCLQARGPIKYGARFWCAILYSGMAFSN